MKSSLFFASFFVAILKNLAEGLVVHRVKFGEIAILPCPSDDKLHRFQYWLLKNDEVVGPWNNGENHKYRYEVWSGRLLITSASESDSGIYKCFSKKIFGGELKSEEVELLVLKDWEEAFENDSKVNVYRAVIAVLVVLMVIVAAIFAFLIKRKRSFNFEESREGSPDVLVAPSDKGVYRATSISLKKPSTGREKLTEKGLENEMVETDISTSFPMSN